MEENYLERLHSEILLVMDAVDELCTKHKIKYYMIGGTLLGAVRHKGFIPWDDDFDIIMPRDDFDKFVKIASVELKEPFKLAWITTNDEYRHLYAKVENSNTVFFEDIKYGSGYPGIFVDIFPLDTTNGYSKKIEQRKKWIKKLATMMGMKVYRGKYGFLRDAILSCMSTRFLNASATGLMKLSNTKNGEWYTNFGSQYSAKKQTIKKEYYGEGMRIPFEDRRYYAPTHSESILKSVFGENYMSLPPKEKRRTHLPQYVKFSDGTELRFEGERSFYKGDFE